MRIDRSNRATFIFSDDLFDEIGWKGSFFSVCEIAKGPNVIISTFSCWKKELVNIIWAGQHEKSVSCVRGECF